MSMGEYRRVGKFEAAAFLVESLGQVTRYESKLSEGFAALMSVCAPIQVDYDVQREVYQYIAFSPLFDDVLVCEGEDVPSYSIELTTNAAGQVLAKAVRQ